MAHRKAFWRKLKPSQVLPTWTPVHSDTTSLLLQSLLLRFGITDLPSYFRKLRIVIAISVIVCASVGADSYGLKGFLLGGALGLIAPAVLLLLGVVLTVLAIYLLIFCAAWAVILYVLWWLLHS